MDSVDPRAVNMMFGVDLDTFGKMLDAQRLFQVRLGYDFDTMTDIERIEFIKTMALGMTDEVHELLGEIGWKPWATSRHIREDAAKGEAIDMLHFMLNIFLVLRMSADEVQDKYHHKVAKNHTRQDHGYDGVISKCPKCKRALDDTGVTCMPANASLPAWCGAYQGHYGPQGELMVPTSTNGWVLADAP